MASVLATTKIKVAVFWFDVYASVTRLELPLNGI